MQSSNSNSQIVNIQNISVKRTHFNKKNGRSDKIEMLTFAYKQQYMHIIFIYAIVNIQLAISQSINSNICRQWMPNNSNRTVLVQVRIKDINIGIDIFVDAYDQGRSKKLRQTQLYSSKLIKLLAKYVENGKYVMQIGASMGLQSLSLAKYMKQNNYINSRVLALQPNQRSYMLLTKSVYINDLEDMVSVYKVAASDKEGSAELAIKYSDIGKAEMVMGRLTKRRADEKYEVRAMRVDRLLQKEGIENSKIGLAIVSSYKMQVQVMGGMQKLLQNNKQVVVVVWWSMGSNAHKNINAVQQIYSKLINNKYKVYELDLQQNIKTNIKQINNPNQLLLIQNKYIIMLPQNKKVAQLAQLQYI